jgi:hypothetical protein
VDPERAREDPDEHGRLWIKNVVYDEVLIDKE